MVSKPAEVCLLAPRDARTKTGPGPMTEMDLDQKNFNLGPARTRTEKI